MNQALLGSLRIQLDDPQLQLRPLKGGGNSRVQLIDSPRHGELVVKQYIADGRQRLETEFAACEFLFTQEQPVPQPLCAVAGEHYAVYQRLQGRPIQPQEIDRALLDKLLDFLCHLHQLREQAVGFGPAAEACLSAGEVVAILQRRRNRFDELPGMELQQFLLVDYDPLASELIDRFRRQVTDLEDALPATERTLSPSDFGFHNVLLDAAGRLGFVDLEYFGWDDPAKLIADFLWHPAMELSSQLKKRFLDGCLQLYPPACRERWRQSHPLHGLKWVLLLINEFIPSDWQRRQFAGEVKQLEERQREQLTKARKLLAWIENEYERNPYGV